MFPYVKIILQQEHTAVNLPKPERALAAFAAALLAGLELKYGDVIVILLPFANSVVFLPEDQCFVPPLILIFLIKLCVLTIYLTLVCSIA